MTDRKKGFTLAELLIVVAIIAVLVAIAVPVFSKQLEKGREAADLSNVRAGYAEVMSAVLTDDRSSGGKGTVQFNSESNEWSLEISLEQKQDGWQTKTPIIVGGVEYNGTSTAQWVGEPGEGGTCIISFKEESGSAESLSADSSTSDGGYVIYTWSGGSEGSGGGQSSGETPAPATAAPTAAPTEEPGGGGASGGGRSTTGLYEEDLMRAIAGGLDKGFKELVPKHKIEQAISCLHTDKYIAGNGDSVVVNELNISEGNLKNGVYWNPNKYTWGELLEEAGVDYSQLGDQSGYVYFDNELNPVSISYYDTKKQNYYYTFLDDGETIQMSRMPGERQHAAYYKDYAEALGTVVPQNQG